MVVEDFLTQESRKVEWWVPLANENSGSKQKEGLKLTSTENEVIKNTSES